MAYVPPMIDEWESLYEVAGRFKELACWKWMEDVDMFGVHNPETGTIGYCSVLGSLGKAYGMIVFQGLEGLQLNFEAMNPEIGSDPLTIACRQSFLSLSYSDRAELEPPDLDVIKSLGLKYRGRNAWPLFRSYRPGFAPWFLEDWEARQFTITLLLAIDIAQRVKDAPDALTGPDESLFMVMKAREEETSMVWQGQWLRPDDVEEPNAHYFPDKLSFDGKRLAAIRESAQILNTVWEVDFDLIPTTVMDDGRPYVPFLLLILEKESGLVLHSHTATLKDHPTEFTNEFLGLIERLGRMPGSIQVCTQDCRGLFEPIASSLNIKLRRVKKLKALDKARESLLRHLEESN